MKKIIIASLLIIMMIAISCKKDNTNKILLAHQYSGILTYEYERDFPDVECVVGMDLIVNKDGTITFSEASTNVFEGEDIYYEGSDPSLKMKVSGTITLTSAQGQYQKINDKDFLVISVNANTSGTKYIWNWDTGTQAWVAPPSGSEVPFKYTDTYGSGKLQFSMDDAMKDGSFTKDTVPDVHGNFVYGYGLNLTEIAN
jgi:hypothetical protein